MVISYQFFSFSAGIAFSAGLNFITATSNREILSEEEKRNLDDSLIHATIVKQDEPSDDQSSIYHIFERLNTGGTLLQPQEIRACIFYGEFNKLLTKLNQNNSWRAIYGNVSKRSKDQELILRFFALYYDIDNYKRPMKEHLNNFMGKNRYLNIYSHEELSKLFETIIEAISKTLSSKAFRPEKSINAAVFDAVMVGLARRIKNNKEINLIKLKEKYFNLISDSKFIDAYKGATADEPKVKKRIEIATEYFKLI